MTVAALVAFAALASLQPPPTEATAPPMAAEPRSYRAVRAVDPIEVDGRGRERTWQLATPDDRFSERQPDLGATPPVRTTLRVAYDDLALYVLLDCESDPGDVIVRTLRRDNPGIFSDDTVYVKVDPQHDRRSGYSFGVNAEGAQIDALGLEDGREFITEWDAVWTAEVERRHDGYTVEFRIPFAILGLKRAAERTMGFEITRDQPSRNATYDWRLIVPPRSPMAASQFGELDGLNNIAGQRAIELTPYGLVRTNFTRELTADPARRPNFASGADVRVQIGAGSYVEASLLTDFAQVEADEVQVARDRFPLFFPERRPFFINGLDVFNFGRGREAQLFFSRRVGLVGGQQVPLLGGAKVYGRTRLVSYGLLHVQTLGSPSAPQRGLSATDPTNVSVARIRLQATRTFNVGMMLLGEHRFGAPHADDAAGGIDAQLITRDGRLQLYGFLAGSWAQSPNVPEQTDELGEIVRPRARAREEIGTSAYSALEYRGLYVRPSLLWLWSDRDFNPRMGFYRRPGASRQEAAVDFAPRPHAIGLREIIFGPRYSIETDPDYHGRLGQEASAHVAVNWRNGANLEYSVSNYVDRLQQSFTLYLYEIAPQLYRGFRQRIAFGTPERRVIGVSGAYEAFAIFGGFAHQPSASITARLGKHFTAAASYTHLIGRLEHREQKFDFGYANANIDIALNRYLAFDTLGRLDLSPGNGHVGLQSRVRWRFLPGSDIFLVYRMDQPLGVDPPTGIPREPFHELTLKFTYYLRAFINR
jgi:Domain of unknown function (DUF5916)/Carbohydrate family 9 binding domain-like